MLSNYFFFVLETYDKVTSKESDVASTSKPLKNVPASKQIPKSSYLLKKSVGETVHGTKTGLPTTSSGRYSRFLVMILD